MNRWRGCACVLVLCALLGGLLAGCRGEIPAGGQGAGGLRVAALAPGLSAMVREMGLGDRIVARHAFDVWSDAHLPAVGDQSGINYEALIASAPTHVLLQAGAGGVPERLTALASARGWRVLAVPMLTLEEVEEADGRVRAFLGVPVGAGGGRLAEAWPGEIFRGRVLLLAGVDPPTVLGPGSYHQELLVRLGGVPALGVGEGKAYMTLDAEDVARVAPEGIVLIVPRGSGGLAGGVSAVDRLGVLGRLDLPGVRAGRVAVIDDELGLVPGPGLRVVGRELGEILERWGR
ncbi:MAG: ABC transporter substrate-binding protein [bacterium]